MGQYIFGSRNKIHILNLELTLPAFNEALEVLRKEGAKGNQILFVGTKRAAQKIIKTQAGFYFALLTLISKTLNYRRSLTSLYRPVHRLNDARITTIEKGSAARIDAVCKAARPPEKSRAAATEPIATPQKILSR